MKRLTFWNYVPLLGFILLIRIMDQECRHSLQDDSFIDTDQGIRHFTYHLTWWILFFGMTMALLFWLLTS